MLLGISWTECVIATILVLLRAYGARYRAGALRWDFVFVAVGTVSSRLSAWLDSQWLT